MYSLAVAVHVDKQLDTGIHLSWCTTIHTYINVELSLSQASVIHCTVRIWDTLSGKGKCLNGRLTR